MQWTKVLLLIISLCLVYGEPHKTILMVGPEASSMVTKYCTTNSTDITPLTEYSCIINQEQVILITAPMFQGIKDLGIALHGIGSFESINQVVLLWPLNQGGSFDPFTSIALSFLPYIQDDQKSFAIVAPLSSEQDKRHLDFKQMLGIKNVVYSVTNAEYIDLFESLVKQVNPSVYVHLKEKCNTNKSKFGCLASMNVVETKTGPKLIKDVEVGDELLTPRGFMPVIYVEDHPNMTLPCVHYGGVWLTEDHFVYNQDKRVAAGEITNTSMKVLLEVRTVVVKGDSFFCHHVLVSSYSRFSWLPSFSFVIDYLPTSVITLTRRVVSIIL